MSSCPEARPATPADSCPLLPRADVSGFVLHTCRVLWVLTSCEHPSPMRAGRGAPSSEGWQP